jgi:diadenosine tetraphosphate (Ap4A) HIT family hydrolase
MAESAEEIYERALATADAEGRLPMPDVGAWEAFPFDGDLRVRPLLPPLAAEAPRRGEDPQACRTCANGERDAIWSDERWLLLARQEGSGFPLVVILCTREHVDLGELTPKLAAELGTLIVRIERAINRLEGIGRVHVCRWGDGSFHFHIWFMARPARLPQVTTSLAAIWDDILPPTPEDVWRENYTITARALAESGGTSHV